MLLGRQTAFKIHTPGPILPTIIDKAIRVPNQFKQIIIKEFQRNIMDPTIFPESVKFAITHLKHSPPFEKMLNLV
jgi:hypothetical protein